MHQLKYAPQTQPLHQIEKLWIQFHLKGLSYQQLKFFSTLQSPSLRSPERDLKKPTYLPFFRSNLHSCSAIHSSKKPFYPWAEILHYIHPIHQAAFVDIQFRLQKCIPLRGIIHHWVDFWASRRARCSAWLGREGVCMKVVAHKLLRRKKSNA